MSALKGLEAELLSVGFTRHSGKFAGGQQANNKLELDFARLQQHPDLLDRVIGELVGLATPYGPQFVVGVPEGATGLAALVAQEFEVEHVVLQKDPQQIRYASAKEQEKILGLSQGVIIEDVINRRTTTERTLQLRDLAPKISAVIAVFDRGIFGEQRPLEVPVNSVVVRPIAAEIPKESELWQYTH